MGATVEDDEDDACAVNADVEDAGLVHVVDCRIRGEMKTRRDRDTDLFDAALPAALLGPSSESGAAAAVAVGSGRAIVDDNGEFGLAAALCGIK